MFDATITIPTPVSRIPKPIMGFISPCEIAACTPTIVTAPPNTIGITNSGIGFPTKVDMADVRHSAPSAPSKPAAKPQVKLVTVSRRN